MTLEETIVQRQLNAYNSRNIEDFCSCFADDIEVFDFPETTPRLSGKEAFRILYKKMFENSPTLNAVVEKRIVFDNKVIDHEKVTGRQGSSYKEVIAIYEIEERIIKKVYFIQNVSK